MDAPGGGGGGGAFVLVQWTEAADMCQTCLQMIGIPSSGLQDSDEYQQLCCHLSQQTEMLL